MSNFELVENEADSITVIKVMGVGGAGGNAVDHMINGNVQGVDFLVANTDAQALGRNRATQKINFGNTGLGAGANPEVGCSAAMAQREDIRAALSGAHMVFITAGMGGGTGTGAAPVVAEVAREMGILSVGVATKPFSFEGNKRAKLAEAGIIEFSKQVDSLIVVLNDKLMDVMGEDAAVEDCFKTADDVLKNAVGGIAEIITQPGLINVDFEDVRTVMNEPGRAMMGSAMASGADRAMIAAQQAVASPLLEGVELSGARGVLVNISASLSLKMREVNEVMEVVKSFAAYDAHIIFGAVFDETMSDELRVTVVATGLGSAVTCRQDLKLISQQKEEEESLKATGTHDESAELTDPAGAVDYSELDSIPAVIRKRKTTAEALVSNGVSHYDIPAFLRKQAD